MELKTKYQYSYFIHPYVVIESEYSNYMYKLLKDKHCNLKIFEKEKDLNLYTYFLPSVRDFMFWTFNMDVNRKKIYESLNTKMKANLLSKYPCTIFEYTLGEDVQGKIGEKNGIFFEISKMEIICFNTGICFIVLKTNLEEENNFSNLLNFNYKFRDINSEFISLKDYENIRLQTSNLKDIKELKTIIKNITGENKGAKELNLEEERFLTYSYVCIDQKYWNEENSFENIENEFIKFVNLLPNNDKTNFDKDINRSCLLGIKKYAKLGATKQGAFLFTSSIDIQNYTNLLFSFEREMLYTYILSVYMKIYLKKLGNEFSYSNKIEKAKEEFMEFAKSIWILEVTDNTEGSSIYNKFKEVLELEYIYNRVKEKYDICYKEITLKKSKKTTYIIAGILFVTLIFNIINFVVLFSD